MPHFSNLLPRRRLALLWCELWWAFSAHGTEPLRVALRAWRRGDVAMEASPLKRRIAAINALRAGLRARLRRYPYWALGHVRLGLLELEAIDAGDATPEPRVRATLRLSAEAATELERSFQSPSGEDHAGHRGRASLEAQYLRARERFFDRDAAGAWVLLDEILAPEHAVQLSRRVHDSALEFGGAALMAMGDHDRARELLLRLPARSQSPQVRQTLAMLSMSETPIDSSGTCSPAADTR